MKYNSTTLGTALYVPTSHVCCNCVAEIDQNYVEHNHEPQARDQRWSKQACPRFSACISPVRYAITAKFLDADTNTNKCFRRLPCLYDLRGRRKGGYVQCLMFSCNLCLSCLMCSTCGCACLMFATCVCACLSLATSVLSRVWLHVVVDLSRLLCPWCNYCSATTIGRKEQI